MSIFQKKRKKEAVNMAKTSAHRNTENAFDKMSALLGANRPDLELYRTIRSAVPIVDAAICKTVRLVGDFSVKCKDKRLENRLNDFLKSVPVGACNRGIKAFLSAYLDSLLMYGTAVGEIITDENGAIFGLYNAKLKDISLSSPYGPMSLQITVNSMSGSYVIDDLSLICVSALNPDENAPYGTSVLNGLPFVSEILLKIFSAIGTNWDRVGNVRYAITYNPADGEANVRENIKQIANEWSNAMSDKSQVSDFIAAGDVNIKVIGADNTVLDSEVPVRQMLEMILAKLGIPPFMLGLSWSTTERMSAQQADILTSELEHYRSLLNPVIEKICNYWLMCNGCFEGVSVCWDNINLQDEVELANARYTNARAVLLENQTEEVQINENSD